MISGLGRAICTMSLEYLVVPESKDVFRKNEGIWNDTGANLVMLPVPKMQTLEHRDEEPQH